MSRIVWLLGLLLPAMLATACNVVSVGPTETEHETVALEAIDSAEISLKMGVGDLTVSGGGDNLLDADFTYNVPEWKPQITYNTRGQTGVLSVEQPSVSSAVPDDRVKNQWELRLENTVEKEVTVSLGVGKGNLSFGGLNLTNLDVSVGVGETTIDHPGAWTQHADIKIKGGIGETTVILPPDVGVRVTTQTGIGDILAYDLRQNGKVYTNDAYETSDIRLTIDVTGGVGRIVLKLGD